MFVTRPFTGRWFDSAGDKGIMTLGFTCLGASMLIMGFAQNGAMLLVSAALAGVGVGSVQPNGSCLPCVAVPTIVSPPRIPPISCCSTWLLGCAPSWLAGLRRIRLSRAVPRHGACGGGELRRVHGVPSSWPYCGEEEIARFFGGCYRMERSGVRLLAVR